MKQFGYEQGQGDYTLFVKQPNDGKKSILIVYVDDMVIIGDDIKEITNLKRLLKSDSRLKTLRNFSISLG